MNKRTYFVKVALFKNFISWINHQIGTKKTSITKVGLLFYDICPLMEYTVFFFYPNMQGKSSMSLTPRKKPWNYHYLASLRLLMPLPIFHLTINLVRVDLDQFIRYYRWNSHTILKYELVPIHKLKQGTIQYRSCIFIPHEYGSTFAVSTVFHIGNGKPSGSARRRTRDCS